jgi:hypothetical protein
MTGVIAQNEHFLEKDIVCKEDFTLIWWEGLGTAIASYPKMYCVWLTKHVSGFCGNIIQLYYWSKGTHSPKCKFCGIEDEHTIHISWCKDPGQDSMFKILVFEVHTWLVATLGKTTIASTVEEYLLGWGQVMMESCIQGTNENMAMISKLRNHLGWDSFL